MKFGIVLIVVILLGIFVFLGCIQSKENEELTAYNRLIDSINKLHNITGYDITYDANDNGLKYTLREMKDGNNWGVEYEYSFADMGFYYMDNISYLCVNREDKEYCSDITNASFAIKGYNTAASRIISEKGIDDTIRLYATLYNYSGLHVRDIYSDQIIGRDVNCFSLELDYSKLPSVELYKLGISPNSYLVIGYKNITQTLCYDNETGMLLSAAFSYIYKDLLFNMSKDAISFTKTADPKTLKFNEDSLEHYNVLKPVYSAITNDWNTYYGCLFEDDPDSCIVDKSFENKNTKFCELVHDANERNRCYTRAITYRNDPSLCEKIEGSQNDMDSCYYLYVYYFGDKDYCREIINDTIKDDCDALNVTPVTPSEPECEMDSDCEAKGLYNEYCVPVNYSIIIDEGKQWKEVYSCYNYTTCGCVDGECAWTPTDEYRDCIDAIEMEEIRDAINANRESGGSVESEQTGQTDSADSGLNSGDITVDETSTANTDTNASTGTAEIGNDNSTE